MRPNSSADTVDEQMSSITIDFMGIGSAYGYEYLKPSSRLVLTPLTLKCFRALVISSKVGYFNALHGPGGVGKTETVKDYCRLMGRMCIVLNCSDAVTSILTGRLLKGVAASRVWVLFDDFNRMSMTIVSVVAQQLGIIRRASMLAKGKSSSFDFEGEIITLVQPSNLFLTLNTTKFEKQIAPVSFKTLFRDATLTHPDYFEISRAILVASGFMCSKVLAELVTDSYSICADIFCTRTSHDWSLRQIIAVFRTASDEIRYTKISTLDSKREILERSIIYKALLRIHEPQFDQRDKQSFRSIIDHVFCDDMAKNSIFTF